MVALNETCFFGFFLPPYPSPDVFPSLPVRPGTLGARGAALPGSGLHRLGRLHQRLPHLLPGRAGAAHPLLRLRLPAGARSDLAGPGLHGAHLPLILPSGADPGPGAEEGHQHLRHQGEGHGDGPHQRQRPLQVGGGGDGDSHADGCSPKCVPTHPCRFPTVSL